MSLDATYITQYNRTQQFFLSGSKSAGAQSWDDLIAVAKEKIKSLEAAIEIFERYRDTGESFDSESGSVTPSQTPPLS